MISRGTAPALLAAVFALAHLPAADIARAQAQATASGAPLMQVSGPEEVVYSDRASQCALRQFPDSPARAAREKDGSLVLFATFENNWFLQGPDWNKLTARCASAGHAGQNADPRALDDKYWIQALYSANGVDFIALGSHEYLGSRHPGMCDYTSSGTMAPPCWYSAITQYVSHGDARHFGPARQAPAVAVPQKPFDRSSVKRVGFFTSSNIVSDGEYRYVLIFAEGSDGQARGNCLFRARLSTEPTPWRGWDGNDFTLDLSVMPDRPKTAGSPTGCRPVDGLPQEARGLVRHEASGTWIVVYSGRIGSRTGVVYSTSRDLLRWSSGTLLLEAPLTRRDPDCAPVYRYPSLIDENAKGFTFETVGDSAFLYGVKIVLKACRPVERQITRIPVSISLGKH